MPLQTADASRSIWATRAPTPQRFAADHPGDLSARSLTGGYTPSMKTAVSVPDDVFQSAERLARRERRSRSEVYSAAIREYVARHAPDEVTEAINEVIGDLDAQLDPFVRAAGDRVIESSEW